VFVKDELNDGEWEFECRGWLDEKLSQDGKRTKLLSGRRSNFGAAAKSRDQERATIDTWLQDLNLSKHAAKFADFEIEPDTQPALTDSHLRTMGINMVDRSRIMASISEAAEIQRRRKLDDNALYTRALGQ
jgi:hypothetical protein